MIHIGKKNRHFYSEYWISIDTRKYFPHNSAEKRHKSLCAILVSDNFPVDESKPANFDSIFARLRFETRSISLKSKEKY